MNANDKFYARDALVDGAAVAPLPNSRKIHVAGSRPDIRVPMREIAQSDTPASMGAEVNPPIVVYDTSGPYTDPAATIDIRKGLPALRARWIADRDELHLRRDDAAARVVHLRDVRAIACAARLAMQVEAHPGELGVGEPRAAVAGRRAGELEGVAALGDLRGAQRRQAVADVDRRGRVGVRARRVVDGERRVLLGALSGQ